MSNQKFGCLQDIKVLSMSAYFAGPFASALFSENGADVIHIESAKAFDNARFYRYAFTQEHRNQRNIALNIQNESGREAFIKMLKWCDIFLEASKGGTFDRWGFSDEEIWAINPKAVIVHISGYGQTGDPEYVSRASYDMTAQAFSGMINFSGPPDANPYLFKPNTGDYITGLQAMWSALAAYIRAQKTGVGESVDIAQYEAMVRILAQFPTEGFTDGKEYQRVDGVDPVAADKGVHKCKDGYVIFAIGGAGPIGRACKLFGLEDDPNLAGVNGVTKANPSADKWCKAQDDYCENRTVDEVVAGLSAVGCPCSRIMKFADMLTHPHYQAREDIIEYYDPITDQNIKGLNAFPKFKNNPQKIVRGGGYYGMDNEDVLKEFGFSDEDIAKMYEEKTLVQKTGI